MGVFQNLEAFFLGPPIVRIIVFGVYIGFSLGPKSI